MFPATKRTLFGLSFTAALTSSSERGERQVVPGERGEIEPAEAEASNGASSSIPVGEASAALAATAAASSAGGASFLPTSSTSCGAIDRAASTIER